MITVSAKRLSSAFTHREGRYAPGMADEEHPSEDLYLRFLKGEVTGEERRRVVRHLLRGCGTCSMVTQRLWPLAGEAPDEACEGEVSDRARGLHPSVTEDR